MLRSPVDWYRRWVVNSGKLLRTVGYRLELIMRHSITLLYEYSRLPSFSLEIDPLAAPHPIGELS